MRHLTNRGHRLNRLWKEIETHSHKYRVKTPIKDDSGRVMAVQIEVLPRYKDPSLRSQLYERRDLREGEQMKAYLQAVTMEPFASRDTRKKWKKAVGL